MMVMVFLLTMVMFMKLTTSSHSTTRGLELLIYTESICDHKKKERVRTHKSSM